MKKIPSVKLPDPAMGVIRSEHPRNVGVRGLVEAYNWTMKNGQIRQRDGITHVDVAGKKVITPGTSWAQYGDPVNNHWLTPLGARPANVWINGELGTYAAAAPNDPSAVGEWKFVDTGGTTGIVIFYAVDPDTVTDYPVYYDPYADGSSVTGLFSYDYQGQDEDGVQGVIRDQLIAATNSQIICYNNDLTRMLPAAETNIDWAWEGAIGPGTMPDQDYVVSPKISIDWSNISWSTLETMHGGDVYGVGIKLDVEYYNPAGISITLYTFDADTTIAQTHVVWSKSGTDTATIKSTEYEQGYPWQVTDSVDGDTGIYFIFSDTWSSWYDELNGQGQNPASSDIVYYWAVHQAGNKGLPGGQDIIDTDRTTRPVFRAWDYEQTTNVLVAAKDKYILAVDSKSLSDLTDEQPQVTVAGDAGIAPRARCIGIASQRVVAGNISYFDSALTCDIADQGTSKLSAAGASGVDGWCSVVDQFAYFPDAVVYSGTVLTGGHTYWYPADILRLADTAGEIVAIQEMGTQQIAVYKSDSIYTLTAQTGISPFAPSLRASGIQGPVGPRAVVALSDQTHLYLGRDGGIYLFSGGTPQSIGEQFRSWISREIDAENYADDSFMHYDPERNHVHVYYPVKGSGGVVRKGMIIDVSRQPFTGWPVLWPKQIYNADEDTLEDVSFLCATMHWQGGQSVASSDIILPTGESQSTPTTKYQELYLGTENKPLTTSRTGIDPGRIFRSIDNGNDHGVAIESMLESGISDLGDPDGQKVLLEMELLFDNIADQIDDEEGTEANIELTIYAGDSNTTLTQAWQDTTISMNSGQITVHPRVRGRYFAYKLVVTAPVEAYNLSKKDWSQNLGEIKFFGAIARYKVSGVRQN